MAALRRPALLPLALAAVLALRLCPQASQPGFVSPALRGGAAAARPQTVALRARGGEGFDGFQPFGWAQGAPQEERSVSRAWYGSRSVLCFGDSLTAGWHDDGEQFAPYSRFLTRRLEDFAEGEPVPLVMNAGVPGESTSEMLERLPQVLGQAQAAAAGARGDDGADVVLILGGTNDAVFDKTLTAQDIFNNIVELHMQAHKAGVTTGVLTIPEVHFSKDKLELVNQALRAFVKENPARTFLVDVAAAVPQNDMHQDLWEEDALHLSPKGYEVIGDLVAEALPPVAEQSSEVSEKTVFATALR